MKLSLNIKSRPYLPLLLSSIGCLILLLALIIAFQLTGIYPTWHKRATSALLQQAVMQDDGVRTEDLLRQGATVDTRENDNPLLITALIDSHNKAARILLRFHADVNSVTSRSRITALMAASGWNAAGEGTKDIVQSLLRQGAEVNAQAADGSSALSAAAVAGDSEIVTLLLGSGADPHLTDIDGKTVLVRLRRHYDKTLQPDKKAKLLKVIKLLERSEQNLRPR